MIKDIKMTTVNKLSSIESQWRISIWHISCDPERDPIVALGYKAFQVLIIVMESFTRASRYLDSKRSRHEQDPEPD